MGVTERAINDGGCYEDVERDSIQPQAWHMPAQGSAPLRLNVPWQRRNISEIVSLLQGLVIGGLVLRAVPWLRCSTPLASGTCMRGRALKFL